METADETSAPGAVGFQKEHGDLRESQGFRSKERTFLHKTLKGIFLGKSLHACKESACGEKGRTARGACPCRTSRESGLHALFVDIKIAKFELYALGKALDLTLQKPPARAACRAVCRQEMFSCTREFHLPAECT
jgi:hypothetical protein